MEALFLSLDIRATLAEAMKRLQMLWTAIMSIITHTKSILLQYPRQIRWMAIEALFISLDIRATLVEAMKRLQMLWTVMMRINSNPYSSFAWCPRQILDCRGRFDHCPGCGPDYETTVQ